MFPNGNIVKTPFGIFMTKGPPTQTLAGRIAWVRGEMRQEDFAARLGIGRTTLIRYESGERVPDADFLSALVKEFRVDAGWILLGGEVPNQELSPREKALVDNYRHSAEEGKRAVEATASALSRCAPEPKSSSQGSK